MKYAKAVKSVSPFAVLHSSSYYITRRRRFITLFSHSEAPFIHTPLSTSSQPAGTGGLEGSLHPKGDTHTSVSATIPPGRNAGAPGSIVRAELHPDDVDVTGAGGKRRSANAARFPPTGGGGTLTDEPGQTPRHNSYTN